MKLPKRNHLTKSKNFTLDLKKKYKQKTTFKPDGFWYSCHNSWIDWLQDNFEERLADYIYQVNLKYGIQTDLHHPDPNKLLVIKNSKELDAFHDKYFIKKTHMLIDWKRVSQDFGGIEICPYLQKSRFKYNWYYTFDVAGGCIWNVKAIVSNTCLIYHKIDNKYVKI